MKWSKNLTRLVSKVESSFIQTNLPRNHYSIRILTTHSLPYSSHSSIARWRMLMESEKSAPSPSLPSINSIVVLTVIRGIRQSSTTATNVAPLVSSFVSKRLDMRGLTRELMGWWEIASSCRIARWDYWTWKYKEEGLESCLDSKFLSSTTLQSDTFLDQDM